ncbi:hypothetical protein KL942_003022 [Ogataea angusta]|uniref:Zn(2)-C6 fungal-type domain-containing protein n=1 Tax=Pichia angusta TaxID=870730 RepID=A0ABQ7RUD0_PICAN|nr:hypothetical protein KL942_003022 [Ogataea angusta]KAG7847552.1 hypothetical protein KL940_003888 [Ogataea angusta]
MEKYCAYVVRCCGVNKFSGETDLLALGQTSGLKAHQRNMNIHEVILEDNENSRKRLSKSCDVCREKKLKCDSQKQCSHCRSHGFECVYSFVKKPGLKPGYGKELLKRLSSLEEESQTFHKKFKLIEAALGSLQGGKSTNYVGQGQVNLMGSESLQPSVTSVDASLSQSQTAMTSEMERKREYMDRNIRLLNSGLPNPGTLKQLVDIFFAKVFPSFPIIHPLETRRTVQQYICAIQASNAAQTLSIHKPPLIIYGILLNSVQYIQESKNISMPKDEVEQLIVTCKQKIILECYSISSIAQLQTIALMAYYSFGNSVVPESSSIIGMCATGMIHLNISVTNDTSSRSTSSNTTKDSLPFVIRPKRAKILKEPVTVSEKEGRIRLGWGIVVLDILNSFSSGTPLCVPESEDKLSRPLGTKLWSQIDDPNYKPFLFARNGSETETFDAFSYFTDVIQMMRRMYGFISHPRNIADKQNVCEWFVHFHMLETEMKEWKSNLPSKYASLLDSSTLGTEQHTFEEIAGLALLHSSYHIALIKMHSAYGYPHIESPAFKHSESSRRICLESVERVALLAQNIMEQEKKNGEKMLEYLGPHYSFCIWVCARVLIADSIFNQAKSQSDRENLNMKLKLFCGILFAIGKHWQGAQKYYRILRQLQSFGFDTLPASANTDYPEGNEYEIPPSQAIADMRINAHLLSLILNKNLTKDTRSRNLHDSQNSIIDKDVSLASAQSRPNRTQEESMLLDAFQFDTSSFGFEDLLGYLTQNNIAQEPF